MSKINIKSRVAILDVEKGRKALLKHFKRRPSLGECPPEMRVPVIIHGYVDGPYGGDDGVSIEFTVIVEKVELS